MIRNSFIRNHHFYLFSWTLYYNSCKKITSKMSFPHRLKYGGNYKICILPIVQKTAEKKTFTICENSFSTIFKNSKFPRWLSKKNSFVYSVLGNEPFLRYLSFQLFRTFPAIFLFLRVV